MGVGVKGLKILRPPGWDPAAFLFPRERDTEDQPRGDAFWRLETDSGLQLAGDSPDILKKIKEPLNV